MENTENIKNQIGIEEIMSNKVFLKEFVKLDYREQLLYWKLRELYKKTDLRDDNGEKYVVYKISEADKFLGCAASRFFITLKERGFIKRKQSAGVARTYLCDTSTVVGANLDEHEQPDEQDDELDDAGEYPFSQVASCVFTYGNTQKCSTPPRKSANSAIPIIAATTMLVVGTAVFAICRHKLNKS
jgi:hypothetical protein